MSDPQTRFHYMADLFYGSASSWLRELDACDCRPCRERRDLHVQHNRVSVCVLEVCTGFLRIMSAVRLMLADSHSNGQYAALDLITPVVVS